jgi:hypothetical protein
VSYPGNLVMAPGFSLADYFDPDLSLALQVGQGTAFEITPQNSLVSSSFSVNVPFVPTESFEPISPTDRQLLVSGIMEKPVLDKDYIAFNYSAAQFRATKALNSEETFTDTRGWVTGSLGDPIIDVLYAVKPHQALVELPGGELTVQEGSGRIHVEPTAQQPVQIFAKSRATTNLNGYEIQASTRDGDLLTMEPDRILEFSQTSSPHGAPPLSQTEIYSRLFGFSNITALLENRPDSWTFLVAKPGVSIFNEGILGPLGKVLGLESLNITYDPERNAQATLITPEFAKSHWSAFRLGATRSISTPTTWNMWLDYRMPSTGLKNFWFTTEVDNTHERKINLQYQLRF